MEKTKVSIITPSLNSVKYIEKCILSVKNQRHQNVEHIVIDGGSTDGTLRVLTNYQNAYDLRWISEGDSGMYEAINKGIQLATGEIIGYLNTDDSYFPWSIELAVKHLSYERSIVFGDLCTINSIDNNNYFYLLFYQPFNLYHYTFINTIGQPTVFLKKFVFDKIGLFDTSFQLISDCEYWLRCVKNGYYPQKINEVMAIQIDHPKTLREKYSEQLKQEYKILQQRILPCETSFPKYFIGRIFLFFQRRLTFIRFYYVYLRHNKGDWPFFRDLLYQENYEFHVFPLLNLFLPKKLRFDHLYLTVPKFTSHDMGYDDFR